MSKLGTEQEDFWIGEFGDSYIARNDSDAIVAGNVQLFLRALRKTAPKSILEIGANIGMKRRSEDCVKREGGPNLGKVAQIKFGEHFGNRLGVANRVASAQRI